MLLPVLNEAQWLFPVSSVAEKARPEKVKIWDNIFPEAPQSHLSLLLARIFPLRARFVGMSLWVGVEESLLRILAESMLLMAQPGIALPLQTTVGH